METDVFPLTPDYEVEIEDRDGVLRMESESRARILVQRQVPQRIFTLPFRGRSTDQVEQLRDWKRRFAASFFRFDHKTWLNNAGTYLTRSFPVEWLDDSLPERNVLNDSYDFNVRLLEGVGRALPGANYPDPTAGHASYFKEEDHADASVLGGTWTAGASGGAHGGQRRVNANTNTTDAFQWLYSGYGFRVWAQKDVDLGIFELFLDGVSLGNVDLYAGSGQASAAVFSRLNVNLGIHRVKIKATNTKNASSSGNSILADALEVVY